MTDGQRSRSGGIPFYRVGIVILVEFEIYTIRIKSKVKAEKINWNFFQVSSFLTRAKDHPGPWSVILLKQQRDKMIICPLESDCWAVQAQIRIRQGPAVNLG